jgi:hypothetical protein
MRAKHPKPWKRAERIAAQCAAGKKLCRYNRQTETGSTEVVFFLEPGGRQVGTRSAENAIAHGLLTPSNDGLLGPEFSQTWSAPQ